MIEGMALASRSFVCHPDFEAILPQFREALHQDAQNLFHGNRTCHVSVGHQVGGTDSDASACGKHLRKHGCNGGVQAPSQPGRGGRSLLPAHQPRSGGRYRMGKQRKAGSLRNQGRFHIPRRHGKKHPGYRTASSW